MAKANAQSSLKGELKPAFIDGKSFETNSPIFLTSTMHKKRQQKMLSLIFRKLDHKNLTLSRTSMICHHPD